MIHYLELRSVALAKAVPNLNTMNHLLFFRPKRDNDLFDKQMCRVCIRFRYVEVHTSKSFLRKSEIIVCGIWFVYVVENVCIYVNIAFMMHACICVTGEHRTFYCYVSDTSRRAISGSQLAAYAPYKPQLRKETSNREIEAAMNTHPIIIKMLFNWR